MARLLICLCLIATPAVAVQPDEILDDPQLEERARVISEELRCLVCRNENIDESNADLARDLRILVRERLVEGDTNEQVLDFVVDRYGEYVLLRPTLTGSNLLLWIAGPLMLLMAIATAIFYTRSRATAPETDALSEDEKRRLDELLKD
ncbi:cytochrome c-type biogenesis protein [Pseudaestuariivita rosea]|uniref:cytochrome c-type biogenesis protein n=1 Tax=Pseudaestuariivita rosea TaxID=2763263 RepID=UPI003AF5F96C